MMMRRGLIVAALVITIPFLASVQLKSQSLEQSKQDDFREESIIDKLQAEGNFKILLSIIEKAQLAEALSGKVTMSGTPTDPHNTKEVGYTLFAPTDEAFNGLPSGALHRIMSSQNDAQQFVFHHLWNGKVPISSLNRLRDMAYKHDVTMGGFKIAFTSDESSSATAPLKVLTWVPNALNENFRDYHTSQHKSSARIVKGDIKAVNGFIHALDNVLVGNWSFTDN